MKLFAPLVVALALVAAPARADHHDHDHDAVVAAAARAADAAGVLAQRANLEARGSLRDHHDGDAMHELAEVASALQAALDDVAHAADDEPGDRDHHSDEGVELAYDHALAELVDVGAAFMRVADMGPLTSPLFNSYKRSWEAFRDLSYTVGKPID